MIWRKTHSGVLVLAMLVGVAAVVATAPAAAEEKINSRDYVTETQLRERGSFRLDVAGVGQLKIDRIMARSGSERPCAVEIASVERGVRELHRRGGLEAGAGLKLSFKATGCGDEDGKILLCCKGQGSDCTVDLVVLSVE